MLTYDCERRLCNLMNREATLTPAERLELATLLEAWEFANDPINSPPPDAGLLMWTGFDEIH